HHHVDRNFQGHNTANLKDDKVIEYTENSLNPSSNEVIGLPDITNAYDNQNYNKGNSELNKISNAGSLYLELVKRQQMDPTFHIDIQFESKDNYLIRLCWMSPSQQQLWVHFHNDILLDSIAKTNCHSMILCLVILVDNHNHSHLAAAAIVSDKTKDTYE
ncbi:14112_t:CDS:2, partial [Cetraspora pellucida]